MKSEPSPDLQDLPPEMPILIARLAWGGGTLVTLLVPLIFFIVGYQSEAARLESALQVGVYSNIKQPDSTAGAAWGTFHTPQAVLAALDWLPDKISIRITGENQQLLAEKNQEPPPPHLNRTSTLELNADDSAQLTLSRSLRPLLLYSLLMFIPGLILGIITFVTLRDLPMRVFRRTLQEITIRKVTEEKLAKSLSIFSATLESTADGIFVTDVYGREVVANKRFRDMWHLHQSDSLYANNNETLAELSNKLRDPTAFAATIKDLNKHIDVNQGSTLELRDGRHFEWNSQPQFVNGRVVGRVTSFRDISDRKQAEALLAIENEVLEMVVCGQPLKAALGVLADHVEVLSGEMFCTILFRKDSEGAELACVSGRSLPSNVVERLIHHEQVVLGKVFAAITQLENVPKHGLSDEYSGVIENIGSQPIWSDYCKLMASHGVHACFAVAVRSSDRSLLGLIVAHYRTPSKQQPHDRELMWVAAHLVHIAMERRQAEERLQDLAHYDSLTRLPNRALFHDRLQQALTRLERSKGLVALMFIDLDRFKTINDTLGHDLGDQLLCDTAARLLACVRDVDTVARLGGDEFTIILEQINKAEDAAGVASKIIEMFAAPFHLDHQETFVTPSIGITIFPSDSDNSSHLIKYADTAMYRAKEDGGNGYRFFTSEMNTLASDRLEMENGLRRALARGEFEVYYQPKLNLADGRIIGAEALLRWRHPQRGLVSPGEFIPILEETGLIEQVGSWVLHAVCQQIRHWQTTTALPPLVIAVNLSGRQLQRSNLATAIADILEETGVEPRFLELEVTESILMHDPQCAVDVLMQIRNKGILHIDVDDFGTGYSSLSYLKQFPIDCLKLDKSFVDGLPHDEDDIAISQAVIAMAHSLRLTVIAEGVEREEQLAFLRDNGCDIIQGYIISPPVPAQTFAQLVLERAQQHSTTLP
ncbi:PAS domain S-box-containing protein/diguanylate cyclase (GGDEF)-like protein [Vogesella indigofera]|uniref:PAS domain S-box-containing protein/diguanylate cyclase (GGDEF)-like protein n=2 Tax=Vogesella indigofera TaxID=45465 RepID=A0A495BJ58_VOGIN|nr:PAS domain S-box-containing protein/diguanylate cyclase (GGDEF)-like protein [Vogesella indigofera]